MKKEGSAWKALFWFVLGVLIGFGIGYFVWGRSGSIPNFDVEATEPYKVICHINPSHGVTLSFANEQAYNGHLDTPHSETVYDEEGACGEIESKLPYVQVSQECGQITLDFYNPTDYLFDFDYREDGEAGFDDEVSSLNIANGTFAGQSFGQRYNPVPVDGREDVHYAQVILNYPEDSGTHTVNYRLWRGAENDWYIPWLEEDLVVESDCEANVEPTPEPTDSPVPTETPRETEKPEVKNEVSTSTASAPDTCPNVPKPTTPGNFHLYRNGELAELKWFPTEGDTVNIYYKNPSSNSWEHSIINSPNDGYEMVGSLGSYDWTFGLQQVNQNCNGSDIVSVVDGVSNFWFLFR